MLWSKIMETYLQILQSISIIIASGVAIYGINTWRREFIGKRRIELAEEVLEAFFKIKEAIQKIPIKLSLSSEGASRVKSSDETPEDAGILNQAHIVFERFDKYREDFSHFAALKYRFMITFGKEHEDIFTGISDIRFDILYSPGKLISDWKRGKGLADDSNRILYERFRSTSRIKTGEKDSIQDRVEILQSKLEEATSPCFKETTCWVKRSISAVRSLRPAGRG
jgi:hypothetical protein